MAHFTCLYSGSSGNCAWIEENGRYLLIDMGKSCRLTRAALASLPCGDARPEGILITHEHIDHVRGLRVFLRSCPVPVYGNAATLEYLAQHDLVPPETELCDIDGQTQSVGSFTVSAFATSHDSVACCGYAVHTEEGKKVALATDLGYVSDEVFRQMRDADVVNIESNYDYHMLMSGPYPYYLKTRIASNRGHLCNADSAQTVVKLIQNGCKHISLCHLSHENNTPQLALQAVQNALLTAGVIPENDVCVQTAARHEVSPVFAF